MENKNKPAFPTDVDYNTANRANDGLTKREYAAIKAMQGMLSNSVIMQAYSNSNKFPDPLSAISEDAIKHADHILKQLEQ